MISVGTYSVFPSDVFPSQKEERSVLPGVGSLKLVAEPEPPLLLELQPAHRLPQRAAIGTDDAQCGTCIKPERENQCDEGDLACRRKSAQDPCLVPGRTFQERELLEEPRSHKGVCETEEQATEEQPSGADVDGVGLGTGETNRRLQEQTRDLSIDDIKLLILFSGFFRHIGLEVDRKSVIETVFCHVLCTGSE